MIRTKLTSAVALTLSLIACSSTNTKSEESVLDEAKERTAATGAALQALAGTWRGGWRTPDGSAGALQIDWRQVGRVMKGVVAVTGACLPGGQTTALLTGASVDFSIASTDAEIRFLGTVSGQAMRGSFAATCGTGEGTWDATLR